MLPGLPGDPPPRPLERVADGIYLAPGTDSLGNPADGNAVVIDGGDYLVVVDANILPSSTRRTVASIRALTPKPVRYLVYTHWHDDHHTGAQVYRDTYPGVQVISHLQTRTDIIDKAYSYRPKFIAELQTLLDGPAEKRKPLGIPDEELASALAEFKGLREVPPDLTFSDRMVLHGSRPIELRFLGEGNTRGDLVVFVPSEHIVVTGDLVVYPTPYCIQSYPRAWMQTLDALMALDASAVYLPGHGPALRDTSYIRQVQEMLGLLVETVDAGRARGLSVEQLKKEITLDAIRERFTKGDPKAERAFRAFVLQAGVESAWREADERAALKGGR
jgi:glyoxylase-like metal-dependent hydrolase (beta-lactamase superfamily II)